MHLDALLEQGRTPEVKDDVIALTEEYHIMTPYTSFLVLESDADRERFKVKRRFQMRDGEKFFAEGRDAANYELLQKQMRLAGTWRLNLRRQYFGELERLGRFGYPIGRLRGDDCEMPLLEGANKFKGIRLQPRWRSWEEAGAKMIGREREEEALWDGDGERRGHV